MRASSSDITADDVGHHLGALRDGDLNRLVPAVHSELRRLAQAVRSGPSSETANTTALVHEAYLKMADGGASLDFEGRAHFLGVAAKAMRQVLVDHARRRGARKPGFDLAHLRAADPSDEDRARYRAALR